MKIETWKVIDALELEALIEKTYGRRFSVLGYYESSNGSVHYLDIPSDNDEWYGYGEEPISIEEWVKLPPPRNSWDDSGPKPLFGAIINDLMSRDLLSEGSFYVHCWW